MSGGFRCVVRYAPPIYQDGFRSLLVRDKRRRRDNEAIEHEIEHADHPLRQRLSDYWEDWEDAWSGWERSLVQSGSPRTACVIPALYGAYEQHSEGSRPDSNVLFDRPTLGGDHVS